MKARIFTLISQDEVSSTPRSEIIRALKERFDKLEERKRKRHPSITEFERVVHVISKQYKTVDTWII